MMVENDVRNLQEIIDEYIERNIPNDNIESAKKVMKYIRSCIERDKREQSE